MEFNFGFSGISLIIVLLALIIYAGSRIRNQNPALFRKYVAVVIILGVVIPISTIGILNLPKPNEVELIITLDFKSNSTTDEAAVQYGWDAQGVRDDDYGILIDWRTQYGDAHSYGTGGLHDLLVDERVEDFNIQWSEICPFEDGTWNLTLSFYVGSVFDGWMNISGTEDNIEIASYQITNPFFSHDIVDGLSSLDIQGLEVHMQLSFKISAAVLSSCFQMEAIDMLISSDLQLDSGDFMVGVISG
jgi:hypothetical protein